MTKEIWVWNGNEYDSEDTLVEVIREYVEGAESDRQYIDYVNDRFGNDEMFCYISSSPYEVLDRFYETGCLLDEFEEYIHENEVGVIEVEDKAETTRNAVETFVKLRRIDICDLMTACTCLSDEGKKWSELHDKLKGILDELDKQIDGIVEGCRNDT